MNFETILIKIGGEIRKLHVWTIEYFNIGWKQDFTSAILNVIKIDTPITRSCNAIPLKQVEHFLIIRNCHTIMQIIAFTITASKAGTKINCRRNGKEVNFEDRRNGSRRNGSRQNGSRRNGNTPLNGRRYFEYLLSCQKFKKSFYKGCPSHKIRFILG